MLKWGFVSSILTCFNVFANKEVVLVAMVTL